MREFRSHVNPRFERAIDAVETASSAHEVVAALAEYADEAGQLALQVFPPELRSTAGIASLAVELTRLGMKRGLDEDIEWRRLERLFARAAVRLSELAHPAIAARLRGGPHHWAASTPNRSRPAPH